MLLAAGSGSPEYFTENCLGLADGIPCSGLLTTARPTPGQKAIDRLAEQFPNTILVHTPVDA